MSIIIKLKMTENKNAVLSKCSGQIEVVLRGITALNAYMGKEERSQ